jgi:hypothetical protein
MKSVVLGAAVAATLTAAVPALAQVFVIVRTVIIRDHEHGWNRQLVSPPCRVPQHARSDTLAEW